MSTETLSVACANDEQVNALVQASMYREAMKLYASMKAELVAESMPRTGLDEEGTAIEIEKSIAHNPWAFLFRFESKKFGALLEARKTAAEVAPVFQAVPVTNGGDFELPTQAFCSMEPGCESCQ